MSNRRNKNRSIKNYIYFFFLKLKLFNFDNNTNKIKQNHIYLNKSIDFNLVNMDFFLLDFTIVIIILINTVKFNVIESSFLFLNYSYINKLNIIFSNCFMMFMREIKEAVKCL